MAFKIVLAPETGYTHTDATKTLKFMGSRYPQDPQTEHPKSLGPFHFLHTSSTYRIAPTLHLAAKILKRNTPSSYPLADIPNRTLTIAVYLRSAQVYPFSQIKLQKMVILNAQTKATIYQDEGQLLNNHRCRKCRLTITDDKSAHKNRTKSKTEQPIKIH
ncbi:hypothetical protein O181_004381 [Austropuccinia psidii MF-1]|uniref:Uncharacterized protein n=1 Tax=Austropuccinia psidii MF-1 TaxID=1389203 RepID=A0A9Q3GEZ1_9BASI|nr:hypothetical protein [Austropuccinia psidii MF-1]